jgi:hypothetical protein
VHQRGPRWDEGGDPSTYSASSPQCAADRAARLAPDGGPFRRFFEDSTWIAAVAGSNPATSSLGGTSTLSTRAAAAMARCGVNLVGLDQLVPEDPRLAALVWSWAKDAFTAANASGCGYQGADTRWHAGDCGTARRAACATGDGGFVVSPKAIGWHEAAQECASLGFVFTAPVNGLRNDLLAAAKGATAEVWVHAAAPQAS